MQNTKPASPQQKRPATIADKAVIVSYGLLFWSMPFVFSMIASTNRTNHQPPWPVYVIFGFVGLMCFALAFAADVNVSPPSKLE